MSEDRIAAALERIEQALYRVEMAGAQVAAGSGESGVALAALSARHEALKSEAQATIAELDRLISAARGGIT